VRSREARRQQNLASSTRKRAEIAREKAGANMAKVFMRRLSSQRIPPPRNIIKDIGFDEPLHLRIRPIDGLAEISTGCDTSDAQPSAFRAWILRVDGLLAAFIDSHGTTSLVLGQPQNVSNDWCSPCRTISKREHRYPTSAIFRNGFPADAVFPEIDTSVI